MTIPLIFRQSQVNRQSLPPKNKQKKNKKTNKTKTRKRTKTKTNKNKTKQKTTIHINILSNLTKKLDFTSKQVKKNSNEKRVLGRFCCKEDSRKLLKSMSGK